MFASSLPALAATESYPRSYSESQELPCADAVHAYRSRPSIPFGGRVYRSRLGSTSTAPIPTAWADRSANEQISFVGPPRKTDSSRLPAGTWKRPGLWLPRDGGAPVRGSKMAFGRPVD